MVSYYFYALHEICGFENVRIYDGSWQEWANLTAVEPADTTYVRRDVETVYPLWPAMNPALLMFAGQNVYLEWNGKQFINGATGSPVTEKAIKTGGTLKGNMRWDTLHRSEHVLFRPSEGANAPKEYKTYIPDLNWPDVDTFPQYDGIADKIMHDDRSYKKKPAEFTK